MTNDEIVDRVSDFLKAHLDPNSEPGCYKAVFEIFAAAYHDRIANPTTSFLTGESLQKTIWDRWGLTEAREYAPEHMLLKLVRRSWDDWRFLGTITALTTPRRNAGSRVFCCLDNWSLTR